MFWFSIARSRSIRALFNRSAISLCSGQCETVFRWIIPFLRHSHENCELIYSFPLSVLIRLIVDASFRSIIEPYSIAFWKIWDFLQMLYALWTLYSHHKCYKPNNLNFFGPITSLCTDVKTFFCLWFFYDLFRKWLVLIVLDTSRRRLLFTVAEFAWFSMFTSAVLLLTTGIRARNDTSRRSEFETNRKNEW